MRFGCPVFPAIILDVWPGRRELTSPITVVPEGDGVWIYFRLSLGGL